MLFRSVAFSDVDDERAHRPLVHEGHVRVHLGGVCLRYRAVPVEVAVRRQQRVVRFVLPEVLLYTLNSSNSRSHRETNSSDQAEGDAVVPARPQRHSRETAAQDVRKILHVSQTAPASVDHRVPRPGGTCWENIEAGLEHKIPVAEARAPAGAIEVRGDRALRDEGERVTLLRLEKQLLEMELCK